MTAPVLLRKHMPGIVMLWGCSCFQPEVGAKGDTDMELETSGSEMSTSTSQALSTTSGSSTGSTTATTAPEEEEEGDEFGSTSEAEVTSSSTTEEAEAESSEGGEVVAPPNCGDGTVDADEDCDDGNDDDTDACTRLCRFPSCGDGWIQEANDEVCELDEVPEGSCWAEGQEWGGMLACSSACDAITTEGCYRWQPLAPRFTHGVDLGITKVQFDAGGNAHVLYVRYDAADNLQVYTVRYDGASATWDTPIPHVRIEGDIAEPFYVQQRNSDIAVAPSGVAFVAYSVAHGGATTTDVYVERFDPETGLWDSPLRIARGGSAVAIDVGTSEQAMLVWRDDAIDFRAAYSRYSPQTRTWSTAAPLSTSIDGLASDSIFVRDDGQAFALTRSGNRAYLSAFRSEWQHTPLASGSDTVISLITQPIAGAAREGSALLSLGRTSSAGESGTDVWILEATAGVVGEPTTIDTTSVALGMGDAGHGAIAYRGNDGAAYLRRLLPGARTFEEPLEISAIAQIYHLAIDSDGNIIVFGLSDERDSFRAVRFDAAAEGWSEVYYAFIPGDGLGVTQARSDIDDSGRLILAMAEGPGGRAPDNALFFRHLR